ncbi:MAG: NACHT domain-containing protein [bacterium]|nr:NACHT domain-containing protein [bacterium]
MGVLDAERKEYPKNQIEGYFISLTGFKESAIEQEKKVGDRVVLLDANRVIGELFRGKIIVSEKRAMEQAVHCAATHGGKFRADESFELLAHDKGWIWVVYFGQHMQRTHFAMVHADGESIATELAQAVCNSDKSVGGKLHELEYLPPPGHPSISDVNINEAHKRYLKYLKNECGNITLEGLPVDHEVGPRRLNLEKVFVPLHIDALADKKRDSIHEEVAFIAPSARCPVGKVLLDSTRLAILAPPGGGKTTLIKRLAVAYAFPERRSLIDDKLPDRSWLPLFIRCRQLKDRVSWPVSDILLDIASRAEMGEHKEAFSLLINRALRDGEILLLMDGLDEISNDGDRVRFITQLRTFLATYPNVNIVLTSREAGFRIIGRGIRDQCKLYKIADFNNDDIMRLTLSWHKEVLGDRPEIWKEAEKLVKTITNFGRIRQLAKNPLMLTTLLLVNRWVGQLPTKRSVLYGKAIEVLLMTWNVEGHEPMDQDEAIPQLAFVAFTMMKDGVQRISKKRLKEALTLAREQMPEVLSYARYSVVEFINRVELRSSLLILSGHEIEQGTLYPMYEFRHLTFQEYLTASAILEGYYPDCKNGDTLLSILEPHLLNRSWREVVPLTAVLAGRKVQSLVEHLIGLCKYKKLNIAAELLSQCIIDEIQLVPKLMEESLKWIAILINNPSTTMKILFDGKYGEVLLKVIQEAYMTSTSDLMRLGGILGNHYLHRMGYIEEALTLHIYKKTMGFLENNDLLLKSIGALVVMSVASSLWIKSITHDSVTLSNSSINFLNTFSDKMINAIYSEESSLHFAACWALMFLGAIKILTPKQQTNIFPRLLELWRYSPSYDVQMIAKFTFSFLPIIDRELKPLSKPNLDSINFIREQYLSDDFHNRSAALVIGFYWKKPWTDEELFEKIDEFDLQSDIGRNLVLESLFMRNQR